MFVMSANSALQLTAQSAVVLWVPSALRAPAATELRRYTLGKVWPLTISSGNELRTRLLRS